MPKLLQINTSINCGSTGKIAEQIGLLAKQQGWDCYAAYGNFNVNSQLNLYHIRGGIGKLLHQAESFLFDRHGLSGRFSTKQLVRFIKRIQPDIIHLHNIHGYYLNYPILFEFLKDYGRPVVWTLHDCWPMTGHCAHFVSANCNRWKSACYKCPLRTNYPRSIWFDRSSKNYKDKKQAFSGLSNLTITPVSDWLAGIVAQSFLNYTDLKVIPNGVDLSVFKPFDSEQVDHLCNQHIINRLLNKFIIVSVASLWNGGEKGLDDFIAMSRLIREDEVIILIGVPEDIIKRLPSNIVGIRRTNNQNELAAYYNRADVVCSLSAAETFGLTIVEGYACGTPAVVYNNTAMPALITPDTGIVVNNKDYKAAYDAIKEIRAKGKNHYSQACIKLVHEKYDKNKCFNEFIELYNSLIRR